MNELQTNLIEETRQLWNQGKKVMVQIAWNLFRIRESGEWQEYDTFPKFVDAELGIKQSQTSKLLTIAEFYLEKYTPEQIGPIDYELLYASAKLPGTPEENLAKAKTLTRDDLKKIAPAAGPHEAVWVKYCEVCGLGEKNHP